MASLQELLRATQFMNEDKKLLITRVYSFSEEAHKNRKRHSESSRFDHSSETAKILAELGMARRTISAGLLHSIFEDTTVTPDEIDREFGKEIGFLVKAITEVVCFA
ncbi:MAG: (P)ppGpp synthetase I, SpoT/RelA [Parcubacteria group bacterium GW2011_GWA2_49_9]|nr:MAG: (P)ppGpp synthetase I, SpoT/RelA [Parcubacteria group bacterium GW2011_GWA2_49_9]